MKRCLNCMEIYQDGFDVCPFCGFVEGMASEIAYSLPPGTVVADRYIIGTVIGAGGFGITYVAWDTKLEIKIAIKEYFPTGLVNRIPGTLPISLTGRNNEPVYQKGMQGFIDEAKALAKFNESSGVVNVFDCIEENGTAYIIMEYIEGQTLKEYISVNEPDCETLEPSGSVSTRKLSIEESLQIVQALLHTLKLIHGEGIIHRDLSPDNIMILKDGNIKLIDFGAARFFAADTTKSMSVVLKAGYAPVEQYSRSSRQDQRTDLYAVGVILYQLLTGKMPQEAFDRVTEDSLIPPSKIEKTIPDWLDSVVVKAMALKQEDRYKNAEEFSIALEKAVPVKRKKKKPRKGISIILVIVVVLLISAAIAAKPVMNKVDAYMEQMETAGMDAKQLENHKVLKDLNDTIGQNYHVVGQKHDQGLTKTDRYTEFGTVNYEAKDWLGGVLCFSKEFDAKESSMNQPECIGYIGTMSDTFQDANYYMVESNLDDLMGVDFTCDTTATDEDKAHGTYMAVGEYKDLTIKIYSKEYRIFPGSSIVYIYNAK